MQQDVVVRLSSAQARHLADALRVQLAMRWEALPLGPVPCRGEVERLRALLEEYGEPLERLGWGEPAGEVELRWHADALSGMARELRQAAAECSCDPRESDDGAARDLLDTAHALDEALRGKAVVATG
jgi:hypothetical protein